MVIAKDEVELINPQVGGEALALLRACRVNEWFDLQGNWHVVVAASRISDLEKAEHKRRTATRQPKSNSSREFWVAYNQALIRSRIRNRPSY